MSNDQVRVQSLIGVGRGPTLVKDSGRERGREGGCERGREMEGGREGEGERERESACVRACVREGGVHIRTVAECMWEDEECRPFRRSSDR
eukprot:2888835-Rhodomonas_salina.1